MKNSISSLSAIDICEYLLVLQPHEELCNKILNIKKQFEQKYSAPSASWSKPQITIIRFTQLQLMQERLITRLRALAMGMPPFKIDLNGFGSIPSHTIYINVEAKAAIQLLQKHLKEAQSVLKTKENKPHFLEHHHITVASQLLPWQYEKGWAEYSHLHFSGRFIANDMLLLGRQPNSKAYKFVQKFEFKNLSEATTQGKLFG